MEFPVSKAIEGDSFPCCGGGYGSSWNSVYCDCAAAVTGHHISNLGPQKESQTTEKEKEDPFNDYVLSQHMPAIPLSGDSVQLKENTAYKTKETVICPQVQPNIAYGTLLY